VKVTTNPRWVAPEAMHTRRISKASDVYSFAIIMYEVGGVTDGGRVGGCIASSPHVLQGSSS
jgi:serine/threonine protein kinase